MITVALPFEDVAVGVAVAVGAGVAVGIGVGAAVGDEVGADVAVGLAVDSIGVLVGVGEEPTAVAVSFGDCVDSGVAAVVGAGVAETGSIVATGIVDAAVPVGDRSGVEAGEALEPSQAAAASIMKLSNITKGRTAVLVMWVNVADWPVRFETYRAAL